MFDIQLQLLKDADLGQFTALDGSYPLLPEQIRTQAPDLLMTLSEGERLVARASLWWHETSVYEGQRLGYIGHFAIREGHDDAATSLLRRCEEVLVSQGCTMAVGPLDGSTWRHYRFLTERGNEPTFFLETDNPDSWPGYFVSRGFTPLARYYSAINNDISRSQPPERLEAQLSKQQVTVRAIDERDITQEMKKIYAVSCDAFSKNFLYTPISESEFIDNYQQILPVIDYRLIHIAYHKQRPVGFCFCLPDINQEKQGKRVDTVITKTIAVVPDFQGIGLGSLLMAKSMQVARGLGLSRSIIAMMHEDNHSRQLEHRLMHDFRQYTLYGKGL